MQCSLSVWAYPFRITQSLSNLAITCTGSPPLYVNQARSLSPAACQYKVGSSLLGKGIMLDLHYMHEFHCIHCMPNLHHSKILDKQMGSVHSKVVSSILLLYLSLDRFHIAPIMCHCEIREPLCYYFAKL